jgi:two-component system, NtrC family, sensor histidine kinase PilS
MSEIERVFDKELLLRIRTIMILRVVLLTGFLVLALVFQREGSFPGPIEPLSFVLGSAYFLSVLYALLYLYCKKLHWVASIQASGDLLVVGGLIYASGGIDSPLSFLYLFVIIATSVVLPRAACYMVAAGASIIYGLLVDLQYFNVLEPVSLFRESHVSFESGYGFYIITLNVASYYAVAYLAGILAHRLRLIKEELALKNIDLEELQAFNRKIIQNMGNGLFTTDFQGRVTSINRAGEKTAGASQREILGRACYEIFPLSSLRCLIEAPDECIFPQELSGQCQRMDGKLIWIRMTISHLEGRDSTDEARGYIVVFEDHTAMKQMQEKISQDEQMAAVGRMSAGLAHEIRNPLASLSGSIQVMQKGLHLNPTYKKLMDIVLRETERLNAIVSDFLNYSQPSKNRKSEVDMTSLVQDVVTLMKNSSDYQPSIKIELESPESALWALADDQQIQQVLWNLCRNGIQAMEGEGVLKIALHWISKADQKHKLGEGAMIEVADTGCGISEEQMKTIFDPFFTTKEDGVGLGLATVYQIVHQNGGTIDVKSELGKGTKFSIFLPLEAVKHNLVT